MSAGRPTARTALRPAFFLAAALIAASVALALVAAQGAAEPMPLDAQVTDVAASLRCPVCQNLSVADSPSRLAHEMRAQIAVGLRAGQSPEEIRAEFVEAYGEWVLLAPPRRGITLLAWLAPMGLLLGGLVVGGVAVRRWVSLSSATPGPGAAVTASDAAAATHAAAAAGPGAPSPDDRRLLEEALSSFGEGPE